MPLIYALSHVPPEVSAYGMAKYSRSSASMRDSLLELSQQKAEAFLNTFYFSYGHASIADLAQIPLAIEQVSLLAAMEIVDEPLWDGQERSTRYQDFTHSPYFAPPMADSPYHQSIAGLFHLYQDLFSHAEEKLRARYPQPETMKKGPYDRTIKARAFDLARYALPLATLTSLGQVTNARIFEQQIRRLMASSYPEVQEVALGMKAAVKELPPFNLLEARLAHLDIPLPENIRAEMNPGPLAPTLTKYTDADAVTLKLRTRLQPIIEKQFSGVSQDSRAVALHPLQDPVDDLLAGLIYEQSALSYSEIVSRLHHLPGAEKNELMGEILELRGPHDAWPRSLQQRPLIFDILIDVGAFRDLNRHRRLDKITQRLDIGLRYDTPSEFAELDLHDTYQTALDAHYRQIAASSAELQPYLLPLAHRRRVLLRMDFAEAAYIIELRSRSSGHFSYRRIANAMWTEVQSQYPQLAQAIHVTPMEIFDPFER